ncbi:hypothetical protein NMY22_g2859 [Coprinellus aureogranulatus]|nr:hypothetical protein NMY22_g2859 [Coprinellus aureogranulatus]
MSIDSKVAAHQIFEGVGIDLEATRQRILYETSGHYLGPMPVQDFFNDFMPWSRDVTEEYKNAKLPDQASSRSRVNCLQRWNVLNASSSGTLHSGDAERSNWREPPPLKFRDSHKYRDRACLSYGVGISIYSGSPFVPRAQEPVMDFANLHSWIEIKPTDDYDAFNDSAFAAEGTDEEDEDERLYSEDKEYGACEFSDEILVPSSGGACGSLSRDSFPPREFFEGCATNEVKNLKTISDLFPFESSSPRGCDTRAQLACYAGAVMATQYRSHLFTVVITGKYARFIRWDRSCAVVTRRIDITKHPSPLFEFFKRFRQFTLEQRGTNPHVRPATKEETIAARNLLKNKAPELWLGLSGRLFLREKSVDIGTQPFSMVEYEGTKFVIPNPHCSERGLSPFGRGSRGTVAVKYNEDNPEESTQCFLKDGWRDTHRISEAEIYPRLKDAGVRNIAEMICGGDWFSPTLGHEYTEKAWLGENPRQRARVQRLQGCLLVLAEVGYPLIAFRMAYHLVGGVADAMEGYKAGIMHRDLTPFNILLIKTGKDSFRGILIDWDHAVVLGSTLRGTRRTGTWQFMSVSILKFGTTHMPEDDRESAFYSLFWVAVRHLRARFTDAPLRSLLGAFDHREAQLNDDKEVEFIGGDLKLQRLLEVKRKDLSFVLEPITRLILELAFSFKKRYAEPEDPELLPEEAKAPAALYAAQIESLVNATVKNSAWMIGRLRKAEEELRKLGRCPPAADWVNNVPEQTTTGTSALLQGLQRSQFHLYPTAGTGASTLKRAAPDSADEVEQGVGDLEIEDESAERVTKRIRTKGKKNDDDQ